MVRSVAETSRAHIVAIQDRIYQIGGSPPGKTSIVFQLKTISSLLYFRIGHGFNAEGPYFDINGQ